MTPSPSCVSLVKRFEGLRLAAYLDAAGIPTIGWGHTSHVHVGDSISLEQAEDFLSADLAAAGSIVSACITRALEQPQFDALVSFQFNTGSIRGSTLSKMIQAGNFQGAADQFFLWKYARVDGKLVVLPGLVARRAAERALFLTDGTPPAH